VAGRSISLGWLERLLVAVGVVCLGYYVYMSAEARQSQREQAAAFESRFTYRVHEIKIVLPTAVSVLAPGNGPQADAHHLLSIRFRRQRAETLHRDADRLTVDVH
jgi:hypothetical protein